MSEAQLSVNEGPFRTAREAIDWVVRFIPLAGIKPGLERMERLMELLDHPHRRLKFIHVAGTNGKGSVCAYLTEVIRGCGYDVGTFTSPYIESYNERIRLNGVNIADEDLLKVINKIKPLVDQVAQEFGQPSMFEISTVIAIEYFARTAYPDFVVWETGLGGRLDSTNIVTPLVSVITNIGHDHMDFLGDTLEKIAAEKAGIIKAGVPVVSAVEQPEVVRIVEETAKAKNSTLYLLGREFRYETISVKENEQTFRFSGTFRDIPDVAISMNGPHQLKNAAVALMTLEVLRQYYALIVEDEDLLRAMKAAQWPGRLEMVSQEPRILIDGAHNPEGAESLAAALKETYSYNRLHFMMGMLTNKNHTGYLRHILPIVDTLILTEPNWLKKAAAEDLAGLAKSLLAECGRHDVEVIVEPDWNTGLERLKRLTAQDDLAVVSGTLYLIGDVRSWIKHQSDSEKGW
ncbi:bifunctional folylpolyglutamate synthase/dihydrofolate synthase [Paenibacillus ehimensis]|uniref:bifunctional folylpolyglutamate synthase/dihydrofolate synthase n=1 Tax=Paenibacillus ehimensis TaxID=79264 RepID=UPI002DBA52E6|nr:folylpolyglutamate synthase/dihydrofolate synthase family protein [Paenibacillus ehimensis]MEC0211192.1 bifunctional folylpolyglutamate synthase/dihydrofolate synthase [Paenibacillus ehimensis]